MAADLLVKEAEQEEKSHQLEKGAGCGKEGKAEEAARCGGRADHKEGGVPEDEQR